MGISGPQRQYLFLEPVASGSHHHGRTASLMISRTAKLGVSEVRMAQSSGEQDKVHLRLKGR